MGRFSYVNKKIKILIGAFLLISLIIYGAGIASQLIYAMLNWLRSDGGLGSGLTGLISGAVTETEVTQSEPFNIGHPQAVFTALLNTPYSFYGFGAIVLIVGLFIIFLRKNNSVHGEMDNERNFVVSSKGSYGTAGWMTEN